MSSPSPTHPSLRDRRLPIRASGLTPQSAAAIAERDAQLPIGPGDRFSGYSVLGVPFASGEVLALRRFSASSLGPGYTSVWHRSAAGRWVFYSNVAPDQSCARYFGKAVDRTVVAAIRLEWETPCRLLVAVPSRLEWEIDLARFPAAWLFNAVAGVLPEPWWQSASVLRALAMVARLTLGTGPIAWTGRTPNGHLFRTCPRRAWVVRSSRARVDGRDVGASRALARPATLADVRIPRRGLFAIDQSRLEPPTAGATARVALLGAMDQRCVLTTAFPAQGPGTTTRERRYGPNQDADE